MNISERIERFIVDELLKGKEQTSVDYDKSLISSGILDSLALLQLVQFIEEQFNTTVGDEELLPENFQTINTIVTFLEKKIQNGKNNA